MDTSPVIGITCADSNLQRGRRDPALRDYCRSVEEAGGVFRLLAPSGFEAGASQRIFSELDGLLFSGGGDVAPQRYGGEPHPHLTNIDPARDEMECTLVQMAHFYGLPFLGICRGLQVINVALGGSLYTHLPDQLGGTIAHRTPAEWPKDYLAHTVRTVPGTWLAEMTGKTELQVNSRHHQGIRELADGLEVCAAAPDDLIEGVFVPDHPFGVAVQWHPENLFADVAARDIFRLFVQAAGDSG